MKIKILKDIPGYKAGKIIEVNNGNLGDHGNFSYIHKPLIEQGWAEEIKDEIDIEEIRKITKVDMSGWYGNMTRDDLVWFNAYRVVKAVIEKLNGDWIPDFKQVGKYEIEYSYNGRDFGNGNFSSELGGFYKYNILPFIKDSYTTEKIIQLCKPELEILFGVK